jgi:uncharacterized GH25 family protein
VFTKKKFSFGTVWVLSLSALFMMFFVVPAGAHLPVPLPDKFEVAVGESVEIRAGLAEPLIKFDYSKENLAKLGHDGGVSTLSGEIKYADGSGAPISFSPADAAKPEDSFYDGGSVTVEKPGTSVVAMRFDFNSGTRPTVAYGKSLINWTADSSSVKRYGGGDVLEITQADNSDPISWGDEITVLVTLRGQPLGNAKVSATYDGAPLPASSEEGEERNNEYLFKETDASGKVAFRPDRPGTWVIAIEYNDDAAPVNKEEYKSAERYPEWNGIRYRAALVFPVPKVLP